VQQTAHLDVRLVHPDHEALVQISVDLLVDGRGRESVTRVLTAEPAGEVDVLAAVDVPHARALGTGDDERRRRDPARDVTLTLGDDAFRRCLLRDRHQCLRSARMSPAARSPVSTPPFRYPWKSCDVCSPQKWQLPWRAYSIPENFVYCPTFQYEY